MAALDTTTLLALGATGVIIFLAVFILGIVLNALVLWVTTKLFKLKDNKYKTALITSVVAAIANFLIGLLLGKVLPVSKGAAAAGLLAILIQLVVSFIVNALLIKQFYKLETGKSFLVALVWTLISLVVSFIITLIVGAVFVAIFLAKFKGGI